MSSESKSQPTRVRQIISAFLVAAIAVAVWWVVEIRTALPPPPQVEVPPP